MPKTPAILLSAMLLVVLAPHIADAGPPYITDDPEPVTYRHWEIYLASIFTKRQDGWTATAPHLEVNYGPFTNVQLHAILPMTLQVPENGASSFGYGDTELGIKVRFIEEAEWTPQIGTFPLLELPTGSHARNLGSGHLQTLLPIWAQKTIGEWTAYGGGGYWINPGTDNRNWWFTGLVIQRRVARGVTPGIEVFHQTRQEVGGAPSTGINFGMTCDLSDAQHIIFSAGPVLEGSGQLQGYLAYQLTFGP